MLGSSRLSVIGMANKIYVMKTDGGGQTRLMFAADGVSSANTWQPLSGARGITMGRLKHVSELKAKSINEREPITLC